jgi:hypothetical protein
MTRFSGNYGIIPLQISIYRHDSIFTALFVEAVCVSLKGEASVKVGSALIQLFIPYNSARMETGFLSYYDTNFINTLTLFFIYIL